MIHFEEVANTTGISYRGKSYGASWGNFNGDTYPDLYVSKHGSGILYLNQGDGTFVDITSQVFLQKLIGDTHGAAWADFDNDGDQDLIQLVGGGRGVGTGPNRMYVNDRGKLEDRASELGIDYPLSRSRTPLWLDFDKDGLLDLFTGAPPRPDGQGPPTIFRQTDDGFEDARSTIDFDLSDTSFGFLSDLSGDSNLDAVFQGRSLTFYDITSIPFEEITTNLTSGSILAENRKDIAIGDFNGDLRPDLYLTRTGIRSDLVQDDSDTAKATIKIPKEDRQGIRFDSSGNVTFDLNIDSLPSLYPDIYIGAGGFNPNGLRFTLSPDDPVVEGIFPHTPGVDRGIYIGYDSDLQRWQILVSNTNQYTNPRALIETSEPISDLTAIGFNPNALPDDDQLLINTEQGLIDQSQEAGINSLPIAGHSVVNGDFDNDMDLDLYIVATGPAGNRPNILYENQGDGTFVVVPDAGGAEGTHLGVGDSVVTADYDLDGFLDLFVTNGTGPSNFNRDAPYQLFHNQGNDNHWLEIDLEGVVSNRDGIGAQVFVTAGGVTQLREQSGGIHSKAQNHQRLHFGLAEHTSVDELVIEWPSGIVQKLNNIPADQVLRIIEPSGDFLPSQPDYQLGAEAGVFIWKEYFDGPYHLRTVGAADPTEFAVNLIANDSLLEVTPVQLETNDVLDVSEFGFSLTSKLGQWQDGIDFHLSPGTEAILSVTQDGVANPRQVNVGQQRARLSSSGWIISSDELPERPAFSPGNDLGLFFGQGANDDTLEFRWSGDGNLHETSLSVLAADDTSSFSPINLEPNDELATFSNGIEIQGEVGPGQDGLDVTIAEPTKIGVTYEQDGLFQPHRVNSFDDLLGLPNAYQLPLATPYGQPEYDPSVDEGIFLWQDEEDFWHLRMTGSEEGTRYIGSIVSDRAAIDVQMVQLEETDVVNTTDPLRIDFDFQVWQSWEDGLDFRFPEGAALTLNLEEPGEGATDLLHIGAEQWSVSELPLDLSGW